MATLFKHPMVFSSKTLWMVVPLCIAVAIVYKTIRTERLKRLPLEIVALCALILAGIGALMIAGWAFAKYAL